MALIKLNGFLYAFCLKLIFVKSRMLPSPFASLLPSNSQTTLPPEEPAENFNDKAISVENTAAAQPDQNEDMHFSFFGPDNKCAILVMSNQGQTSLQQSLLRKYRYNKYGDLIPGSVQYYIKFPQGKETAVLVPLKDEAFSPSGGFVRYYKEVPPIPQSWRR